MKSQISKNIEDYMEDDLYGWGGGDYSVLTDKRSRERVKKHHTITTDYHHKKFDDFIKYNYIPYGLKLELKLDLDNDGQFWFMTKNGDIRPDETLERANSQYKNHQYLRDQIKNYQNTRDKMMISKGNDQIDSER